MTKLRETTKKLIIDTLDSTRFTKSNFSIIFSEEKNPFVTINFIPEPLFTFSIQINADYRSTNYQTLEAPGQHFQTKEVNTHNNLSGALESIAPWAERILEDYRSNNPLIDEFESFKQTLNEQFESHINDKDSHFSREEIAEMTSRLSELSVKLEQVVQENTINEKKLQNALNEIENMKSDLALFPKGVWYRMAGSKIIGALKMVVGSSEGRQFALDVAKKFFIEGPK